MAEEPAPVRRIVTGTDAQRKSAIIEDGPVKVVRSVPERPGYRVSEVWMTHESPVPINDPDRVSTVSGAAPPAAGTLLRIVDFPPEPKDPAEREAMARATFARLYPDAAHEAQQPGMHATDTVDYAIVISGEITAILEDGETVMRQGDVLVQRGTRHAWANRSGAFCRVAFVLIDGRHAGA